MSNTINWGKIYEKTAWGIGVVTNTISWGKIYANLVGLIPSFALDFANIANDFTFTRSSFATRVNENGLIETVTDLGSELVRNGDFEELGSELITNGSFDTDSDWNKGASWSISDGKATSDGSVNSFLTQNSIIENGKTYSVSFEISGLTSGAIQLRLGSGATVTKSYSSNQTVSETFTSDGTSLNFYSVNGFNGSIDNVSVKEVNPNNDWIEVTGWSIEGGKATYDDVAFGAILNQISVFTIGKKYRVSLDVESGSVRVKAGNSFYTNYTSPFDVVADDNTTLSIQTTSATATIDNVSVQEISEDDVPRIDYSTGEGAFLLEPQSTNLIDYSEDFSQWFPIGSTSNLVSGVAPNGNTSVYELTSVTQGKLQGVVSGLSVNTEYTFSFYVKQLSPTTLVQSRVLSQTGGSGGSNLTEVNYQDQLVTDKWVRITHTFTTDDTLGNYIVYVSNSLTVGESLQFWGAQVEALPYATSYIPTNGSIATRSVETCLDATPTINSEEGVLYAEISALADDSTTRVIQISDGTNSNRIFIGYWSASNQIRALVQVNGVTQFFDSVTSYDILNFNKIAFKYKENDFALWVNGTEVITDTSGTTFPIGTLTQLDFDSNGSAVFYGNTKDLKIYDKALTDEELLQLTTI